jgi:hypothetical protein
MGPGWLQRLGLDPAFGEESDLFGWWVACHLRSAERHEQRATDAWSRLRGAGPLVAGAMAESAPSLGPILAAVGVREPEAVAARLSRGAAALLERFEGSFSRLSGDASSLEEIGTRLVSLGPGFGPATALRFLRPLRDRWPAADEAPLDPAAHAAAVHLGWLDSFDDLDTAPGTLRQRLGGEGDAPPLPIVEEALERLGRAACRRNDTRRCPLGEDCPIRP